MRNENRPFRSFMKVLGLNAELRSNLYCKDAASSYGHADVPR